MALRWMFAKRREPVCRCRSTNMTPNVITTDATTRRSNSWRASKPPAIATAGFLGRAATVLHSFPMKRARQKPGLNFKHHQGIMKQTVLITGTSSGLGKTAARLLARSGWNVVATMRRPEAEKELANLDNGLVSRLDVQDGASITEAIEAGIARFGQIDALI